MICNFLFFFFFYLNFSLTSRFTKLSRLPESKAGPMILLWVDDRSNKYYASWRCNTGTTAVAFQSRTALHTRLGKHNCPCPSCSVQSPRKTNTIVCVALGPARVAGIRANRLGWLCRSAISLYAPLCHNGITSKRRNNVIDVTHPNFK